MARLYANENFPFPTVESLRGFGHIVLTTQDTGKSGQSISDADVLEFARSQGMAVLTLNRRHFVRLHMENPDHAGMIVCTFDPDFASQARRIHESVSGEIGLEGKLLRVNRPGK